MYELHFSRPFVYFSVIFLVINPYLLRMQVICAIKHLRTELSPLHSLFVAKIDIHLDTQSRQLSACNKIGQSAVTLTMI